jgi:hypothetical protein
MSREQRQETREGQGRQRRVPLGAPQQKLTAQIRSGYVGRWVNDEGGRLQQAEAAGYSFVSQDTKTATGSNADPGTRISRIVGSQENGQPLRAYLMEQTEENYAEDQAAKQRQIDAFDEAMKRGQPAGAQDGTYVKQVSVERR